jgi:hypothetical protein
VLKLSDRLRRRPEIAAREVAGGAVLVDMAGGRCWELNRVGAEIWARLDGSATLEQVLAELRARYGIPDEVLARDLLELGDALLANGLLQRQPGEQPGGGSDR